jgi:alpha-mannosidase
MLFPMTRREFLASAPALAAVPAPTEGVCVVLCNHWSYIGIGWQLGIESNVLSVEDAMGMADTEPGVRTCLNLDARAYEFLAEKFPEVAARLSKYLAQGKIELIGGTYGQPMGTMFSGESNIRQLVVGRETIRKAFGYEMITFLEEEEFTHPQIPQIAAGAGFKYASLAQVDTWGRAGVPMLEANSFLWQGQDGTAIPSTPKNSLFLEFSPKLEQLSSMPGYQKLRAAGKPLVFTWEEFGWESPEKPTYLTAPAKYKGLAARLPVEFVTLAQYMDRYGAAREKVYFDMDSWTKLLTWGLGGDQLRVEDRKVEALLASAERFDAIASKLGGKSQAAVLERAWRDLLASQSHDVGLCEYSRWQGDRMAPLDRIEDYHNFTWGAIGYNHLDAARKQAGPVLRSAMAHIASRVRPARVKPDELAATVFNSCEWERAGVVETGRIHGLPASARSVAVRDAGGKVVPSQSLGPVRDGVANLIFVADRVPGLGYGSYYLEPTGDAAAAADSGLSIDENGLTLANEHLRVTIDRTNGAIASLKDAGGRELLASPFPVFHGTPNRTYNPRSAFGNKGVNCPERYSSAESKAQIDFLERGPVRASLRARHKWPLLEFETRVNVYAHTPWVEVISRVLAGVPPLPDEMERGRFPAEIRNGYWLSFTPGFEPRAVVRDFPLGVEPAKRNYFHALTFVDLTSESGGLLVLHPGTQYFRRTPAGAVENLIMREWESFFTGEYGWPRYAEYRHILMPHGAAFTNAERLRASSAFSHKLLAQIGRPGQGDFDPRRSFLSIEPENVQLLAFRSRPGKGCELRVTEVEGRPAEAGVRVSMPFSQAAETDLTGKHTGPVKLEGGAMRFAAAPWRVRTFELL